MAVQPDLCWTWSKTLNQGFVILLLSIAYSFCYIIQSISKSFESRVIASIDEYTPIVKQNTENTTACYKNRYLVYLNSSVNMILFYEWSRQFRVMKRVEIKYFNAKYTCHLFQIRLSVSDCHLLICYGLLNPIDRCIM